MDNYGQTMKGPFIAQVIADVSALVYGSPDAGRLVFDTATGKMFFGDSIAGGFRSLSDIPSNAIILFESDTQEMGYTLLTNMTDGVIYYTSGSMAGGETGGTYKTGGEWALPRHTHAGPSHTHTGPSHTHTGPSHSHDISHTHTVAAHAHSVSHTHTYSGNTSAVAAWNPRDEGGGSNTCADSTHYHNISGTTSDVSNGATGNSSPATGGPSTSSSSAAGTGATGAAGTGATGASGTGDTALNAYNNSWRPIGRNYTRQRRN